MESPTLAVVIVNYQSRELVERCIASLRKVGRQDLVIVVDNSPEPEFLSHESLPQIEVIVAGTNGGFAAGCNLGIQRAQELALDYILLLNPDTRTEEDFVSPVLDLFMANPQIGAAAPKILADDESGQPHFSGAVVSWWRGGPKHAVDNSFAGADWFEVDFVTGCAMFLRAAAVEQVGLMDERYFLYFEDADYVEALKHANWKIAYVPAVHIFHKLSATTGVQSESYVYYFSRNRLWYLKRWAPCWAYYIYFAIHVLIKLPGSVIVFGLKRSEWNLTRAFWRGTKDAVRGRHDVPISD